MDELKKTFNPEFLNRVDEVVVFHQLQESHIVQIIDLMVKEMSERLVDRGLTLELTKPAKEFIVKHGYDPANGARPLRRALQRYVEDPLSEELLRAKFKAGDRVIADMENDTITFRQSNPAMELESASTE